MARIRCKPQDLLDDAKSRSMTPPLLLLLPGLDGTGKLLTNFIEALGNEVESRVLDYPKDVPLGYEELEQLIRPVLPADRPFVLLAESFGGPLAIRLAASRPPGLTGLILCTTFAKNPYPLWGWMSPLAFLVPIHSLPRWLRALLIWGSSRSTTAPAQADRAIAGVARSVVARRIASLLTVDTTAAIRRINTSTLVVYARNDRVISFAATRWLAARLPQAKVVCIDGPHLLLQSRPRECAALVLGFVKDGSLSESRPASNPLGLPPAHPSAQTWLQESTQPRK
jgi:pimeloyl-ACP methyl ester carboxylesterase